MRCLLVLWRHFLPRVASGAPFYLAADRQLIGALFRGDLRSAGGIDEAVRAFHAACSTLVDSSGPRMLIREHVFQRVPGQAYTRVICLAVQQVLVVESMLHDGVYSEQSYFPRYRDVLGAAEPNEHSSPLATAVFSEIWRTLARELTSVPGASDRTVTFEAGRGRDRNRQFPLSQALLTTHDLTIIREESPGLHEGADNRSIVLALLRTRGHLGLRARKLIAAAATDDAVATRLAVQVRSFLSSDILGSIRGARHASSDPGRIIAYLERVDAFDFENESDTYAVYHRTEVEQHAGEGVEAALRDRLSLVHAVVLTPDADGFREWTNDVVIDSSDAVMAIVLSSQLQNFIAQVEQAFGATFGAVRNNLSDRFAVLVCTSGVGPELGFLLGARHLPAGVKALELDGGLLADARSHTYLMGYPPTGIRYEGRLLGPDEALVVGGADYRVGAWFQELGSLSRTTSFRIQIGRNVFNMSVASRRPLPPTGVEFGYVVREGELEIAPRTLDVGHGSLRGTQFSNAAVRRHTVLSKNDLMHLIERGRRLALSEEALAVVLAELRMLGPDESLAQFAARQVAATRSVPLRAVTSGLLRCLEAGYIKQTFTSAR